MTKTVVLEPTVPENPVLQKSAPTGPRSVRRKALSPSEDGLIEAKPPGPDVTLPLIVRPAVKGLSLPAWAAGNAEFINSNLRRHGALLFRDFNVRTTADFQNFLGATGAGLMEYRERSSPRSQVGENVYTSTDYPADQSIFPHNEHSYSQTFPLKLFFYCLAPAEQGGRLRWLIAGRFSNESIRESGNVSFGESGCTFATSEAGLASRGNRFFKLWTRARLRPTVARNQSRFNGWARIVCELARSARS